uniref:Uncharacterized protein n=1 Tax=Cacopsylla melanoneura TaxID=428564 RepID=A0A8D8TMW6_9HEMI
MYQHKYDIKNEGTSTAISAHAFENNHNFNFDEVKIIRKEDHYIKKRKPLEAFFINQTKNSINFKTDVGNIVCKYIPEPIGLHAIAFTSTFNSSARRVNISLRVLCGLMM